MSTHTEDTLSSDPALAMDHDGNVLVYSRTRCGPTVNQKLTTGQQLLSANGNNRLILQADGNLVLYRLDTGAASR